MNRTIILLLALLVVVGVAIGMTLYLRSSSSAAPSQLEQTQTTLPDVPSPSVQTDSQLQAAVQAAFRSELAKHPSDNTKLRQTIVAGNYAIQVYDGDIAGGEALLKYDLTQKRWTLIDGGGGAWSLYTLLLAHVPRSTAMALLAGISQ